MPGASFANNMAQGRGIKYSTQELAVSNIFIAAGGRIGRMFEKSAEAGKLAAKAGDHYAWAPGPLLKASVNANLALPGLLCASGGHC